MSTTSKDGRTSALSLSNLSLTLGEGENRTDALIDINLDVAQGELVAVTGRSGSGKSSLLNVAGGLLQPSAGSVTVGETDLNELNGRQLATMRRKQVGFVFQDLNLLPQLTAAENVSLPLELDGWQLSDAREAAATALVSVEIPELANRYPADMSGGQRQRVAIARGLVGNRSVLLADEPTGALDEVTGEGVMYLLREQCDKGAACILVTHDPSLAAWADRVVRLRDGRIDSVSVAPTEAPDALSGLAVQQ